MAKIYTKNKSYSGYTASVKFNQGVGETNDPYLIEWFRAAGFEVVLPEQVEDNFDLAKMKKDELIALAEEKGLEVNQKMTKDQIIDLIEAEEEEAEDLEGDQEEESEDEEGEKDEEAGE